MGTPFLSEIRIFSFNFPPKGWAECNGQFLPINQNQALFSLLGTQYGGNGQTNFALPDLRGRAPVHVSQELIQGQATGEEFHTLNQSEMPAHNHMLQASSAAATTGNPVGNLWAENGKAVYSAVSNTAMAVQLVGNTGGSQPHENRAPFLVLNFCIALIGVFPSRN